jgi:prophage antirepressor-like protein
MEDSIAIQSSIVSAATQPGVPSGEYSLVTSFQFENQPVRIVMVDCVAFFIAKDLAPILGFKNARQAVRNHVSRQDRKGVPVGDTPGGAQTLLGVTESGVYALAFGSRKPEAQAFKDWVTGTVLPTIRRTRRYDSQSGTQALLGLIMEALRSRGAAKERQLNKVVAHRDGTLSLRVGRHWVRRVRPSAATNLPLAHSLREGLVLSELNQSARSERKALIH